MKEEIKHHSQEHLHHIQDGSHKKVPRGVLLISIYDYVRAAIALIMGISLFINKDALAASMTQSMQALASQSTQYSTEMVQQLSALIPKILIATAIFYILTTILFAFMGYTIYKLKNWSRILHIVLSVLLLLVSILSLIAGGTKTPLSLANNMITLVVTVLIIWYLGFHKDKQVFLK